MMMKIIIIIIMTTTTTTTTMMSSSRRRRGYLITVTFETVYTTPHFSLYSSISVHCPPFRLPHSMLKVLYRNLPARHFIGKEEQ
jgi:nitrate/TMAO reductase-like tetraheme cytochrome c subunit